MAGLRAFRNIPARLNSLKLAKIAVGATGEAAPNAAMRSLYSACDFGSTKIPLAVTLPDVPSRQQDGSSLGWQLHAQLRRAHIATNTHPTNPSMPGAPTSKAHVPPAATAVENAACVEVHSGQGLIDELVEEVLKCANAKSHAKHEPPVQALAECVVSRVEELSPKQIRDLTVAFAQLNFFDSEFRGAIANAMKAKLNEFEPDHLADTALAFADAGYYDYDLFMKVLVPHLRQHVDRYDAGSLAKLLAAFSRAGLNDEVLMDLMHEVVVKLGGKEDSRAVAEVVYAYAHMGCADERVHNLASDYAKDHIDDFDAESVSKLTYGLIATGFDDERVLDLLVSRAKDVARQLSPEDVARMMWGVGELGYYDEPFLAAMADVVAASPDDYTPTQLAQVVTACNKLSFISPSVATAAQYLGKAQDSGAPAFIL